ncbi:DUF1120 domain-containing protein [Pseudomonas sichuanensis]|uniref:DUF1120 domain-containing protein n=1 Tax=Pseudomonas sichuanensis TaxID=2213015 RepID=UPI0013003A0A|nr:DUF1120 domain-containing protein [Pseudomonas sichuanensis]
MTASRLFLLLANTALVSLSFASSASEVNVTGTITPSACVPSLSGEGSFHYGKIGSIELHPVHRTQFVSTRQLLSITCSAPTRFALRGIDGRSGSAEWPVQDRHFGLGMNGAQKVGTYFVLVKAEGLALDGNTQVVRLRSADNGVSWQRVPTSDSPLPNDGGAGLIGFALAGGVEPSATRLLKAVIEVDMHLAPGESLTLTDEVLIDGAATLEVSYL